MEGDIGFWEHVQGLSGAVWVALALVGATIFWFLKWAITVLFIQGKGISLVTVPATRLATRILEEKFTQRINDAKALPKLHVPRDWDEFNRFSGHVAQRMSTYRELIYMVQARFNGPSAICLRIAVRYFEGSFVKTFETAERGFRNLDRVDAHIRAVHREIHAELSAATNRLERERIAGEKAAEMTRLQLNQVYAELPFRLWLRKRSGHRVSAFFGWFLNRLWRAGEARELRKKKADLAKELARLRKQIAEAKREIFTKHEPVVVGLCLELIEHDQMFLQNLYHRFWLELESLTFTVATGRLMNLLAEDSEAGASARDDLGLEPLLALQQERGARRVDVVRAHLRADTDFRNYVGLGPEAVLEASLEPYFRVKLLLKRITLPDYSIHWIAHLPPPAEFGRAQADYDHFPHQLAWLKKPIPGLRVLDNGLVEIDDDADTGEPAIAAE